MFRANGVKIWGSFKHPAAICLYIYIYISSVGFNFNGRFSAGRSSRRSVGALSRVSLKAEAMSLGLFWKTACEFLTGDLPTNDSQEGILKRVCWGTLLGVSCKLKKCLRSSAWRISSWQFANESLTEQSVGALVFSAFQIPYLYAWKGSAKRSCHEIAVKSPDICWKTWRLGDGWGE